MNRRELLTGLPALGLLASPVSAEPANGAVSELEIFRVKVNHRGNWVIARLRTADGVTGLGDASHGGPDEKTVALLKEYFEVFKGQSIHNLEAFRAKLQPDLEAKGRPAVVAFSALEQCLWDIRGKQLGLPVCDLLGGRLPHEIRNYANINRSTVQRDPAGFAQMAEKAVQAGFDAVKLAPFDDIPPRLSDLAKMDQLIVLAVDRVKAVRHAIGPEVDLLIDVHSRVTLDRGLKLVKDLEPLNLYWVEEVTPGIQPSAEITRAAKMTHAGGESVYGLKGFYPYLEKKAFDVVMPDVKYCGGVWELKKIAAMAEAAGVPVSPHGPASPVGNIAAAHVCVGLPNFTILEYAFGEASWRAELIEPAERMVEGRLVLPDGPGFGIALNETVAARHRAT
jgi:galactonate dehydratase